MNVRHCWHVPADLDIEAMNTAAQYLVGKHDFKSFASARDNRESSVRTIFRCDAKKASSILFSTGIQDTSDHQPATSGYLHIEVEGNGFLYNMVRNIVGSLVEVGIGRWPVEKFKEALEAHDRTAAGPIAPPNGLCLT